jgi:2-keto-3-deoxy-L-rhamnonate aldolase RhmA
MIPMSGIVLTNAPLRERCVKNLVEIHLYSGLNRRTCCIELHSASAFDIVMIDGPWPFANV